MKHHPSLAQFQEQLYSHLDNRANAVMALTNALSSNTYARSVVELSLNPLFEGRHYSDLYKAINAFVLPEEVQWHLMAPFLPRPQKWPFWLLGVDVVPHPRPYAATLEDRGLVYRPQVITSNKPITIGHAYSTVVLLTERLPGDPPWVVPLSVRRVASHQDRELVGAEQVQSLLTDKHLPFHQDLCVEVGDSSYSKRAYLATHRALPNLVTITRLRSNRVFYRAYAGDGAPRKGHPRWYGDRFALGEPETWHPPDEEATFSTETTRGRTYRVHIQAWRNMLMRGTRDFPMQRYPFTLVRIEVTTEDGIPLHRRPLWLLVMGVRREELSLREIYEAYLRRPDQEHYHRFSKQRLLATTYQTPDAQREEQWWRLTQIVYFQLWLARPLTRSLPRPWERYLPHREERPPSPSLVQRDFSRLIRQLGTPARAAKPRGKSPGRAKGTRLPPRKRHPVVRKALQRA